MSSATSNSPPCHTRPSAAAAHALSEKGVRNAVRAGIDIIEHGVFLAEDVIGDMARRGAMFCPTVEVYRRMAEGQAPDYAVHTVGGRAPSDQPA